jgi:NAD(P)-dependent dehydrogenase (short-subunit alcohol dehydrogenase family)
MDLQLAGKRALVTGGSRGIGRAIARQLALEGTRVAIAALDPDRLKRTAEELSREVGAPVFAVAVDTGSDASVKAMVEAVVHELGGLDILVNAAARPGGHTPAPRLEEMTDELFWQDVNVKVLGYIRAAREAAPHMAAAGWGRIINVSGHAARHTGSIIGSIRNVAVSALTKNLADELAPKGINVTAVHPAATRTERLTARLPELAANAGVSVEDLERRMGSNLIGRIVDSSEVADIVAFLASPRSVAIDGDAIACGGGSPGSIHY